MTDKFTTAGLNRTNSDIDLSDALDILKKDIFLNLNCHALATIQSFNSTNQTVTATVNYKKTYLKPDPATGIYSPVLIDYPLIIDCPVIILQGGSGFLTFPISAGDTCLILFNDRDIDQWFSSGQIGPPATARLHSFADGIALIGLNSSSNSISNYDQTRVVLQNGSTLVGVGASKVKVANSTDTLNSLLQDLITEVKNLVTATAAITVAGVTPGTGVSLAPPNATAITAIGTSLTTTATKIAGLLE